MYDSKGTRNLYCGSADSCIAGKYSPCFGEALSPAPLFLLFLLMFAFSTFDLDTQLTLFTFFIAYNLRTSCLRIICKIFLLENIDNVSKIMRIFLFSLEIWLQIAIVKIGSVIKMVIQLFLPSCFGLQF